MRLSKFMRLIPVGLTIALILGCGGGGGSGDDINFDEVISSVSFDLAGAIGVAIDNSPELSALAAYKDGTDAAFSNFRRVNPDSSLSSAVQEGSVNVSHFMIAPGNQVYLLLSSPVEDCILIRVDGETNEATCVDSTLASINWDNRYGDPIQFDAEGNIYYQGTADGRTILRMNASGEMTDLINDYISLEGFLVLFDGNVMIVGETDPTDTEWTRIVSPDRSLKGFLNFAPQFLARFPDNNVYIGGAQGFTIARYLTATAEFDTLGWIGSAGTSYYSTPADYTFYSHYPNHDSRNSQILRTSDGQVYIENGNLVKLYPVPSQANTTVSRVTISKGILTYIFLAGLDSNNHNKLVLFDTDAATETDLLSSEEIEVYHLAYLNANDRQIVMFDGLRFSDNQYVLCQVDLTDNNALTCSKTGTGQLTEFQLFDDAEIIAGGAMTATKTYLVGGEVDGLHGTIVLENKVNGDTQTLTGNGPFNFPLAVASAYDVVVKTQPEGQTCEVSDGSGTVSDHHVTSIFVDCATNPGVILTVAEGAYPHDLTFDAAGDLYFSQYSSVGKIDEFGFIVTVAGTGSPGFSGDGGPAISARLSYVNKIAIDSSGNLFIADTENHRIRKVDTDGIVTTVAGDGSFSFSGDGGPATDAQLRGTRGIAFDAAGNLYIADTDNHRIRKVDTNGIITTVAGNGDAGSAGDSGPATAAQLSSPLDVAFDSIGNLYIADRDNHRIRKVDTNGIITAVAGDGSRDFLGDGGLAVEAALDSPEGVALDASDNLYIADSGNDRIRIVSGE